MEEAREAGSLCEGFLANSYIGIANGETLLAVNSLCMWSVDFTLCAIRSVEARRAS